MAKVIYRLIQTNFMKSSQTLPVLTHPATTDYRHTLKHSMKHRLKRKKDELEKSGKDYSKLEILQKNRATNKDQNQPNYRVVIFLKCLEQCVRW